MILAVTLHAHHELDTTVRQVQMNMFFHFSSRHYNRYSHSIKVSPTRKNALPYISTMRRCSVKQHFFFSSDVADYPFRHFEIKLP